MKKQVMTSIDAYIHEEAKKMGLNISHELEIALRKKIREEDNIAEVVKKEMTEEERKLLARIRRLGKIDFVRSWILDDYVISWEKADELVTEWIDTMYSIEANNIYTFMNTKGYYAKGRALEA